MFSIKMAGEWRFNPSVHRAKGDRLVRARALPVCDNEVQVGMCAYRRLRSDCESSMPIDDRSMGSQGVECFFRRKTKAMILFDLILYVPSTIFQLNRDGSSWVEPVLS